MSGDASTRPCPMNDAACSTTSCRVLGPQGQRLDERLRARGGDPVGVPRRVDAEDAGELPGRRPGLRLARHLRLVDADDGDLPLRHELRAVAVHDVGALGPRASDVEGLVDGEVGGDERRVPRHAPRVVDEAQLGLRLVGPVAVGLRDVPRRGEHGLGAGAVLVAGDALDGDLGPQRAEVLVGRRDELRRLRSGRAREGDARQVTLGEAGREGGGGSVGLGWSLEQRAACDEARRQGEAGGGSERLAAESPGHAPNLRGSTGMPLCRLPAERSHPAGWESGQERVKTRPALGKGSARGLDRLNSPWQGRAGVGPPSAGSAGTPAPASSVSAPPCRARLEEFS